MRYSQISAFFLVIFVILTPVILESSLYADDIATPQKMQYSTEFYGSYGGYELVADFIDVMKLNNSMYFGIVKLNVNNSDQDYFSMYSRDGVNWNFLENLDSLLMDQFGIIPYQGSYVFFLYPSRFTNGTILVSTVDRDPGLHIYFDPHTLRHTFLTNVTEDSYFSRIFLLNDRDVYFNDLDYEIFYEKTNLDNSKDFVRFKLNISDYNFEGTYYPKRTYFYRFFATIEQSIVAFDYSKIARFTIQNDELVFIENSFFLPKFDQMDSRGLDDKLIIYYDQDFHQGGSTVSSYQFNSNTGNWELIKKLPIRDDSYLRPIQYSGNLELVKILKISHIRLNEVTYFSSISNLTGNPILIPFISYFLTFVLAIILIFNWTIEKTRRRPNDKSI